MNESTGNTFFHTLRWFIPTTWADVVRRSGIRIGFCALPYLVVAYGLAAFNDDRLLHSMAFWWCVVIIPGAGFLLDLWRVQRKISVGGKVAGSDRRPKDFDSN